MTTSARTPELWEKTLPLLGALSSSTPVAKPDPCTPMILLISDDAALATAVEKTVRDAMVGVVIRRVANLDEASVAGMNSGGLLVLGDPGAALIDAAKAARDPSGLPRWAVVICRSSPDGDEAEAPDVIVREQLSAPLLRRVVRGVIEHHRLRRENARFRGDLTTFGFRVAHDLRTPLGGVLTTTEMLKEILEEDSPDHVPLTQPIIDSADGLVKLIERTSFLAKISASTEARVLGSMSTPFWNAFQQVESQILKAGASLAYPTEWPMVTGHAGWLEVVWANLISNALQHAGPQVRMEAGWTATETGIRYWLVDSGSVAPERRSQLFQPFNRLHEPRAPRGLGLAMVRRIVELEGGHCGYEPMPAGGSCFFFELPAAGDAAGLT